MAALISCSCRRSIIIFPTRPVSPGNATVYCAKAATSASATAPVSRTFHTGTFSRRLRRRSRPISRRSGHPVGLRSGRLFSDRAPSCDAGYRCRLAERHRKIGAARRLVLGTTVRRGFPAWDGRAAHARRRDQPKRRRHRRTRLVRVSPAGMTKPRLLLNIRSDIPPLGRPDAAHFYQSWPWMGVPGGGAHRLSPSQTRSY